MDCVLSKALSGQTEQRRRGERPALEAPMSFEEVEALAEAGRHSSSAAAFLTK